MIYQSTKKTQDVLSVRVKFLYTSGTKIASKAQTVICDAPMTKCHSTEYHKYLYVQHSANLRHRTNTDVLLAGVGIKSALAKRLVFAGVVLYVYIY